MWMSAKTLRIFILAMTVLLLGNFSFAQELKLSDLVDEALKNNPDILASQARIEASKHRIPQSKSLPDPLFIFRLSE